MSFLRNSKPALKEKRKRLSRVSSTSIDAKRMRLVTGKVLRPIDQSSAGRIRQRAAQRDRATRITRIRDPAGNKRKAAKARRSWQRVPINCQVDYVCDGRTRPGSQIDLMSKRSRATWTPNDQMYTDARLLFKWLAGLLSDADDAAQKKPEI